MYVIIWEFQSKVGREAEFEAYYGSDGAWAKFFGRGEGYIGTELHRDTEVTDRYVTMDYWTDKKAYDAFRTRWLTEYQEIDRQCEELTQREVRIGGFQLIGGTGRKFF